MNQEANQSFRPDDALEAMLRAHLQPGGDRDALWQRISASAARPIAGRIVPAPWRHLSRFAAVAASILIVLSAWWLWPKQPTVAPGYPAPTLSPSLTLHNAGEPKRGAEITSADTPGLITLGDYCRIALAPNSRIRLEGKPHAEEICLEEGSVLCDITPGVGPFALTSEVGTVQVTGTKFAAALGESDNNQFSTQGVASMSLRTLKVAVLAGTVLVSGVWGQTPVYAGDTKTFGAMPVDTGQLAEHIKIRGFVQTLKEMNCRAGFTLSAEQKTKLNALLAEADKDDAPKADAVIEKMTAVLTKEQAQAVQAELDKRDEQRAELEKAMQDFLDKNGRMSGAFKASRDPETGKIVVETQPAQH